MRTVRPLTSSARTGPDGTFSCSAARASNLPGVLASSTTYTPLTPPPAVAAWLWAPGAGVGGSEMGVMVRKGVCRTGACAWGAGGEAGPAAIEAAIQHKVGSPAPLSLLVHGVWPVTGMLIPDGC